MYKSLIRPVLFKFNPESVHHFTFSAIKKMQAIPGVAGLTRMMYTPKTDLSREVLGLTFSNPVGMAAGFDKDGKLYEELGNYGFGFVEVGTVTPKPQGGNELPRLFRLPADQALINRMGFNNQGVDALVERLKKRTNKQLIIGGNIGKNKLTPNEEAVNDYLICFEKLFDYVDYFVVNVSSPNTPNLRDLQEKEPLTKLLARLQEENNKQVSPKPILLKIAPDLTEGQLDDIVAIVQETGIAGVIATNTTISREGLETPVARLEHIGMGGLSGKPVRQKSTAVIQYLKQKSGGSFPIIAVGGIFTAADAREKLAAGASLVQVYTGFIYEGPGMVKRICAGLV
jgi:dihydroorotate dehydrogenase